jgi:hypothetical protein
MYLSVVCGHSQRDPEDDFPPASRMEQVDPLSINLSHQFVADEDETREPDHEVAEQGDRQRSAPA